MCDKPWLYSVLSSRQTVPMRGRGGGVVTGFRRTPAVSIGVPAGAPVPGAAHDLELLDKVVDLAPGAIVLLHHMDVVPADRAQWKTDPFRPTIQDGELWGRGSMDMKGQGVAQRAVTGPVGRELLRSGEVPARPIRLLDEAVNVQESKSCRIETLA